MPPGAGEGSSALSSGPSFAGWDGTQIPHVVHTQTERPSGEVMAGRIVGAWRAAGAVTRPGLGGGGRAPPPAFFQMGEMVGVCAPRCLRGFCGPRGASTRDRDVDEANDALDAAFGDGRRGGHDDEAQKPRVVGSSHPSVKEEATTATISCDDVGVTRSAAGGDADGGGGLTHVDASGRASMVDVGDKAPTVRVAIASARVLLGDAAYDLVATNRWVLIHRVARVVASWTNESNRRHAGGTPPLPLPSLTARFVLRVLPFVRRRSFRRTRRRHREGRRSASNSS